MKKIIEYFNLQINEISHERSLTIYGAILAICCVLTSFFWLLSPGIEWMTQSRGPIFCWPYFNECSNIHFGSLLIAKIVLGALSALGVLTASLFLFSSRLTSAYLLLLLITLFKTAIVLIDYRLRLNQHVMFFWVSMVFLFFPNKKQTIKILIVLFYFWSGILKLNNEWLSGSALYIKPWFFKEGITLQLACVYVVVLELFIVWGLYSKNRSIRIAVFVQLLVFHLFSYPVVGFFYPVLMAFLLVIFPLSWVGLTEEFNSSWHNRIFNKISYSSLAFLCCYFLFQAMPYLKSNDRALTGDGRLLALHMFDAKTYCTVNGRARYSTGSEQEVQMYQSNVTERLHCDPVLYLGLARHFCRETKKYHSKFLDFDWKMTSRRSTDESSKIIVNQHNFCSKNFHYGLFERDPWIDSQ